MCKELRLGPFKDGNSIYQDNKVMDESIKYLRIYIRPNGKGHSQLDWKGTEEAEKRS